ncbi:uncharacterized protein METZ01_LOCUS481680, partial [marine metagenome]
EGISIGDSLLDYMTEDEIINEIEKNKDWYLFLNEPNKYAEVLLNNNFSKYDDVSVFVKNNLSDEYVTNKNEKYKILSIRASIFYEEDFDNCIIERDKIVENFSKILPSAEKFEYSDIHPADPSGDSIVDQVYLDKLPYEGSRYTCIDWGESITINKNYTDHLNIVLENQEIMNWFENY